MLLGLSRTGRKRRGAAAHDRTAKDSGAERRRYIVGAVSFRHVWCAAGSEEVALEVVLTGRLLQGCRLERRSRVGLGRL